MADDFEFAINEWVDKTDDHTIKFVRTFVTRIWERIREYTPVLTGRLRASIQPSQPIQDWDGESEMIISTNVEYARRIEYGFTGEDALGRKYHQTGAGMFTKAHEDAAEIADEVQQEIGS